MLSSTDLLHHDTFFSDEDITATATTATVTSSSSRQAVMTDADDADGSEVETMHGPHDASYDIKQTELFDKFFTKGKHLIDMTWTRTRIGSADQDRKIAVDILTTSRTVKGLEKSPHDVLFRTHQYEFRILPNEAFFKYMGVRYGYMLEMTLYRKRDSVSTNPTNSTKARSSSTHTDHTDSQTTIQDEIPGTRLDDLEQFDLFTNCGQPIILVNMQEDVDTGSWLINFTWTKNTKISLKGDFCLRIDCYRKIDGDTLKRAFSVVSSCFTILSKPLVYALKEKREGKKKKKHGQDNEPQQQSGHSGNDGGDDQDDVDDVDDDGDVAKSKRRKTKRRETVVGQEEPKEQNTRHRASNPATKRRRLRVSGKSGHGDGQGFATSSGDNVDVEQQMTDSTMHNPRRIQISGANAEDISDMDFQRFPESIMIDAVSEWQGQQQGNDNVMEMGYGLSMTKTNDFAYLLTGIASNTDDLGHDQGTSLISDSMNAMIESMMQQPQLQLQEPIGEREWTTSSAADMSVRDPRQMITVNVDVPSNKQSEVAEENDPTSQRGKVQKAKQVMAEVEEKNTPSLFSFQTLQSNATEGHGTTMPTSSVWLKSPLLSPLRGIAGGDGSVSSAIRLGMLSSLATPRGLLSLSFDQNAGASFEPLFSNSQRHQQQQSRGSQDVDEVTGSQQYDHLWQSVAEPEGNTIWEQSPHGDSDDDEGVLLNSQRSFYNRYYK